MGIPAALGSGTVGTPPAGDKANAYIAGQFGAVGPGPWLEVQGAFNCALYASINTSLATTKGSLAATLGSGTGLAAGAGANSANVPAGTTLASLSGTSATLALPTIQLTGYIAPNGQLSGLAETSNLIGAAVTDSGLAGLAANTTVQSILTAAVPGVSTGTVQLSAAPKPTVGTNVLLTFNFALSSQCITTGTDTAALFTGAAVSYSGTVQLEKSFDGGKTPIVCGVGGGGQLAQYPNGTPVSFAASEPEIGVLYRWNCIVWSSGVINHRLSTTGAAATSWGISPS